MCGHHFWYTKYRAPPLQSGGIAESLFSMVAQECTSTSRPQRDRPCSALCPQCFRSLSALFSQHFRSVTALKLSPHTVPAVFPQSFRTVPPAFPHCFRSSGIFSASACQIRERGFPLWCHVVIYLAKNEEHSLAKKSLMARGVIIKSCTAEPLYNGHLWGPTFCPL